MLFCWYVLGPRTVTDGSEPKPKPEPKPEPEPGKL